MVLYRSLKTRFLSVYFRKMSRNSSSSSVLSELRKIFGAGLDSVKPRTIFHQNQCLQVLDDKLKVSFNENSQGDEFNINGKKIHLIGFGKAVLSLAHEVEKVLKERLVSGVISVPFGSATTLQDVDSKTSVIKVFEGAKDNLPDENSFAASKEILDRCSKLGERDILLCLISGGGSALLPYPTPPITLKEKTDIIKTLSRKGSTIDQLNTVRIAMSQVKGGKLAFAAKNAHQIICLIMSDIINDPLDLIASGPTVTHVNPFPSPLEILEKFDIISTMSNQTLDVIKSYQPVPVLKNVKNFIIANNEIAIRSAMKQAKTLGYEPVFLSKAIMGDVKDVCKIYESLTKFLLNKICDPNDIIHAKTYVILRKTIESSNKNHSKGICVISGGEPVVTVTGNGIGGRNQELALRFTHFCTMNEITNVYLLSAGTDGIDGPGNDAAGAIGTKYCQSVEVIQQFLVENDSYNFYKRCAPEYHVVVGHTGTNVMDLQILVVLNEKNTAKL